MSDRMVPVSFDRLLGWIVTELRTERSIFGIPQELFYIPRPEAAYADELFGHPLETPIGPAAGPHTQMAQNIVSAWLCGGRFIELKTAQILDQLEIPRPCIDVEDEGYNVEWSQELSLEASQEEYVKAWALIHIVRRLLGFEAAPCGTVFNMSVGYDLEGILSPRMQTFMAGLEDAGEHLEPFRDAVQGHDPRFADMTIPDRIVDNVTLSTMHGCPPDEIERIARYLLEERELHTTVKLNPTLLGKEEVLRILHDRLGFRSIDIPDRVFNQDLRYERALKMIQALQRSADARGLSFAVKLSNTLAMSNVRGVLPGDEMYMSGRALYPITVNLFRRLVDDLGDDLKISFSAGADAFNLAGLVAAGAYPVTVATDVLKPGGYGRLRQYLDLLGATMKRHGAKDLRSFTADRRSRLREIARTALEEPRYQKAYRPHGLPKVTSKLDRFDCIDAPCVARCAVLQDVPDYAHWLAAGDDDSALQAVLHRNPLPAVTGYVCTHLCQTGCTRNVYDEPVAIRRLKRFAAAHGEGDMEPASPTGRRVAILGSGPSGLAAAYFLARCGIDVKLFEKKDRPGGMLAIAPDFRLPDAIIAQDLSRIERLGATIACNSPPQLTPQRLLEEGFDAVYVACGFALDAPLPVAGIHTDGVFGALEFLDRVARGRTPMLGDRVVVVGGGNTAMDAARTAQRLTGRSTTVVYRRTRAEMPAEPEEIEALLAEGNELMELVSPTRVLVENGRVGGLDCLRNRLGPVGSDGRRQPETIAGSEFVVPASTVLFAIGQRSDAPFLERCAITVVHGGRIRVDIASGRTNLDKVYAGGDIVRGPAIIIEACADGRRAAEAICADLGVPFHPPPLPQRTVTDEDIRRIKVAKARKAVQLRPAFLPVEERAGFEPVEKTLDERAARAEAERCLQCHIVCDRCVEVCPNRANLAIRVSTVDVWVSQVVDRGDRLEPVEKERVAILQRRQILHLHDLCYECGDCATFCTHEGRPFADKPRLFFQRGSFEAECDNAWFLDGEALLRREGGILLRLEPTGTGFIYDTPYLHARLSPELAVSAIERKCPFEGAISLAPAIEMAVLLGGIGTSARYLPSNDGFGGVA